MSINAAIFILTQNTIERKVYLKTTLYFLFKNFNSIHRYPVIILHEGDYDHKSQEEIIKGIRDECRHLVSFKELDKDDFKIPSHIDINKLSASVKSQPVPYWRSIKYRSMCYFWIRHFFKYCEKYEYVMRLDDDSIIEEPLTEDLFDIAKNKELVYVSNFVHVDCGICCYGMKDLFDEMYPAKKEQISKLFTEMKIEKGNIYYEKFMKTYQIVEGKKYDKDILISYMPTMYYNNFFVTSTAFWKRADVQEIINKIDIKGSVFYYRHGDAPLHTLIVTLIAPDSVSRTVFKYSKMLQRSAFIDSENNIHSFMPKDYKNTSCITYKSS
jgi:hypothetical protein